MSIATVSRVMNNRDGIADRTREKVLRVAEEVGYHPQAYAQGLARQTKNIVMAIVPLLSNYFFMEVLEGIQDEISKTDFDLNIYNIKSTGNGMFNEVEKIIRRQWADGYLLISTHLKDNQLKTLENYNIPVSLVDEAWPGLDSVSVNNAEGIQKAMNHFFEQGLSRVALISASKSSKPGDERIKGYRKALKENGIPFDEKLIVTGRSMYRDGFSEKNGYEAMQLLLSLDPLPHACFCVSDIQAVGAIKAMREKGIQIPIIGYDDITISDYIGLSTIRQPMYEMGASATQMVIKRIANKEMKVAKKVFTPELVLRASSQNN